jgi:integrase
LRQRGTLRLDHRTWRLKVRRTDESGKARRTWIRIGTVAELPTRAAARRAADRYLERINPRELHAGTVMRWADWCDRYIDTVLYAHATGTRATQASIIGLHLRQAFPGAVHEVDEAAVQAWAKAQHDAGAAASTVAARFAVLRRMLRQAEAEGLAATPPTSRRVRLPKNEQMHEVVREKAFSEAECKAILAKAAVYAPHRAAFALGRYVGLRGSEICGLTWRLIDLPTGAITVRQQALDGEVRRLKTDGSKAVLQAPPTLLVLLRDYRNVWTPNPGQFLFADAAGKPLTAEALRDELYGYLDELGLRRRGLHGFRHACAIAMADAGVNPEAIRRAMRHSSLRVTAIYLSAAPEDIAAGLARGAQRRTT